MGSSFATSDPQGRRIQPWEGRRAAVREAAAHGSAAAMPAHTGQRAHSQQEELPLDRLATDRVVREAVGILRVRPRACVRRVLPHVGVGHGESTSAQTQNEVCARCFSKKMQSIRFNIQHSIKFYFRFVLRVS